MSLNEQREAAKIISELLEDPYNQICADCQCQPSKWASTTLGVFICIDCSGVHRSLGTHISFVRSCTLDTWVMDQARLMKAVGNRLGNSYWESKLPKDFQRPGNSNRSLMQAFIKDKYQIKKWADAGPPPHIVYKHLLTKQLSNQMGENSSRKSKNSKRSHHHTSHRSSSRRSEKVQNPTVPAESSKPAATAPPPVTPAPDDLNVPLDDFFAEQPRRMIPKPYIPHKKVIYEKPKEEPDYENMNSDEIDKFFQNNGNDDNEYINTDDQSGNENGRGRSDSLEKAMMQRIQNILEDENPKRSLNKNKSQVEYDDNYDDEEEDDIFGDSAVAVTYPFGQHVSRSDPQINNTAQGYETFDDDAPANTASLQSFFDKTSNSNNNNNNSNTVSNLIPSDASFSNSNLSSNITTYSNLNISSNTKPQQVNSDNEEDSHRHQAIKSKQQRSVVLRKSNKNEMQEDGKVSPSQVKFESNEIQPEENQNESNPNSLSLNEQETNDNNISIDKINLDIAPEYAEMGGAINDDAGFWDDDAGDNNNLDDGFFELPPNSKLNNIKLEGKAILQTPIQQLNEVNPVNETTTDTIKPQIEENNQKETENQNIHHNNFSLGISDDFESFDKQKTENSNINQYDSIENENQAENESNTLQPAQIDQAEATGAIIDYNPFTSDEQASFSDNPLASFVANPAKSSINNQNQEIQPQENEPIIQSYVNGENLNESNENENTEVSQQADIDLNALVEAIEEEEEKESIPKNDDNENTLITEEEEEEKTQSNPQQEESQLNQDTISSTSDKDVQKILPAENETELDQQLTAESKTETETNQNSELSKSIENNQTTEGENENNQNPEVFKTIENDQNSKSANDNNQIQEKPIDQNSPKIEQPTQTNQQNQPPAYISRPSKLSISMISAMDLAPPGVTAEDELMDDFFAEAEATIGAPSTRVTTQIQAQNRSHHSKSRHRHRQQQQTTEYDDGYDNANFDDNETRNKKQNLPDVQISRNQKSAFAPPPARKPGAHIPARLQKKMEPPPSEKETTRRKKHHHRKPE